MSPRQRDFRLRRFPPVQFVLYLLLRTVLRIVGMFPCSMAPDVARWIGRLVRLVDRRHGRIAAKTLEKARSICPPHDIPDVIDRIQEHLGLNVAAAAPRWAQSVTSAPS